MIARRRPGLELAGIRPREYRAWAAVLVLLTFAALTVALAPGTFT